MMGSDAGSLVIWLMQSGRRRDVAVGGVLL